MRISNVKTNCILILCILICQNAYNQSFKILKESKSSLKLEFTLDTFLIKEFIENENKVDFSKLFYCVNQLNKPILPLFNFTFELDDASLKYKIENRQKTSFKIKSIRKGEKSPKRGITANNAFENSIKLIHFSDPYIHRSFLGQNLQITPIEFDSINNEIICYYKLEIELQFDKLISQPRISSVNSISTNKKTNFYSFNKKNKNLKSIINSNSELLIIYKDSNENNAQLLANWKNQKGLKTNLLKLENEKTSEEVKNKIIELYTLKPNLKYIILLGNHSEIPAHSYGTIDGDIYFSDSYFGQLTNDFYPELYIGRITGNIKEIKSIISKSIYYERDNFEGDWMIKSIGIASNEGASYGDDGEADWQHLQKIKKKLYDFGYSKVHEFYDGTHGDNDLPGSPNNSDVINALNEGVSLFNYTGHGDDNLMLTSQLSSSDLVNLNNPYKNPFVISVACDNGKFTTGQGTLAESFLKSNDTLKYTGSIAFCGSSILMDWAPPMLTQDEIINFITSNDTINTFNTIGELFYESQMKMLNKYNLLGHGVMQTWILFGDPSLDLKSKIPKSIDLVYDFNSSTSELVIDSKTNNILLGVSKNNNYISSSILKSGINKIKLDTSDQSVLLTFTKPNFKTLQYELKINQKNNIQQNTEINIFPNPSNSESSYFKIKGLNTYNKIELVDILGKSFHIDIENNQNEIKIQYQDLSSGVYFLKIYDTNNHITSKRIIIK